MTVEERQPLLNDIGGARRSYQASGLEIELEDGARGNHCGFWSLKKSNSLPWSYTWRDLNACTVESTRTKYSILKTFKHSTKEQESPKGRQILKNVTGVAHPGELTVVMGSSGAGKTTLLNCLTFCRKTNVSVTGDRFVNGYPADRSILANLSAYVQQDELFLECLTVREHLIFQAMVRMGKDIPRRQRVSRVDQVISDLGLKKCENTIIRDSGNSSGISGGERKRLSFASEVLTDPPMMFCDEPTSGLDSVMALNVISVLKSMAENGKTIVCTIHQPSSEIYSMFDKIILLAEGRTAFLGTREEASHFFNGIGVPCPVNYNPPDLYIQLLAVIPNEEETSRERIAAVCDSFEESPPGIKLMKDVGTCHESERRDSLENSEYFRVGYSQYKTSWSSQFEALIWRSWLCVIKDPVLVKMRIFQNIIVSLMIGILYFGQKNDENGVFNINGVVFTFLTNMTFQNVFAVITVFCSEQPIFLREHLRGMYRVDVYFLCKTLAEIPIFLLLPVMFVSITYYTVGLNPGIEHFFLAVIIVVLVANAAISFGYFISSISSSVSTALSVGPPVIIPFLLFGGFLLNLRSIPYYFYWLSYLSWFRYGNEALLINQWSDIDYIECESSSNSTCPKNGRLVLEMYDFHSERFLPDLFSLFVLIVIFRAMAFFALLSKTFKK